MWWQEDWPNLASLSPFCGPNRPSVLGLDTCLTSVILELTVSQHRSMESQQLKMMIRVPFRNPDSRIILLASNIFQNPVLIPKWSLNDIHVAEFVRRKKDHSRIVQDVEKHRFRIFGMNRTCIEELSGYGRFLYETLKRGWSQNRDKQAMMPTSRMYLMFIPEWWMLFLQSVTSV